MNQQITSVTVPASSEANVAAEHAQRPARSMPTGSEPLRHMVQLDSLRAFAVSGVLLHHFLPVSIKVAPFGAMGVKLFFVLSGFLITGILLKCKQIIETTGQSPWFTIRRFYIRRFLRIFPLFYFVLIAAAILNVHPTRETFFWHASYLSNVYIAATGDWPGPLSPFWTLAVEEQFYLIWPCVILFVPRKHLPRLVILTIIIAPVFRLIGVLAGLNPSGIGVLPLACLDTLGLGAFLAICSDSSFNFSHIADWLTKIGLWFGGPMLIGELLLYILGVWHPFQQITFDLVMGLVCVWLIARASKGFGGLQGKILELKPLIYVGVISYGVYVYHTFVQGMVFYGLDLMKSNFKAVGLLILAGVVLTGVMFRLFGNSKSLARRMIAFKPLTYIIGISIVIVIASYLSKRIGILPLSYMNAVVYFVLPSAASITVAALSWELMERPINNLKERFKYRASLPMTAPQNGDFDKRT